MPWVATSGPRRYVDGLAIGEAHIGFALVAAGAGTVAERACLALHVDQVHRLDFDAEQALYCGLDVSLGRGRRDFEHVLVVLLQTRTLFGDVRRAQDAKQMLFHASHSSMRLSDSTVM